MPSFINYNNKQELSSNEYTKLQISEALYLTETKSSRKIESLTEGLNRTTSLKDALDLFENKLVAMNALAATKQTYSGTLYEGQFSWMTQDSGQQIGSEKENTIEVWMYDNKGNQYYEKKYDGYGEFGGMDYYELLARMNGYTDEDLQDKKFTKSIRVMGKGSMRDIGIAIAFEKLKTRDKGGDVLFPALVADGKFNWKRHNFKIEAESDPNQSWFQEEEEDDDDDWGDYNENLELHTSLYEQAILENAVRDLHFETDPKKAEELKIEIGKSQGEVVIRKQIEGGEYSLKRFRKEIKYDTTGKDLGLFKPGSYMAATSDLGDGPHAKKVKKVKWTQKKYDQWLEDVASNDGWKNAGDMAQNAKHEPGLLDWAKKAFRGEDVMQRIQWDIEAFAEAELGIKHSVVGESDSVVTESGPKCSNKKGHSWKEIDKDGTVECEYCGLRNSLSEEKLTEANGQTIKEFGDLLALLLDEDSGLDIERAINAMDPKKARVLEKQISTLYKRLFDLTNQGFDLREDSSAVGEAKSNIAKKWGSTNTMMDDLREFITDARDAGGEDLVMDIADALKLMTNYAMGMTKESVVNEAKTLYKKDDLVYNNRTETVGIVRIGDDGSGEVKTDADGNVNVDELEDYMPFKYNYKNAKIAPSTKKEVIKRRLFYPFNESLVNESLVNEAKLKEGRDEALANAILAYFYAVDGTPEGDAVQALPGNPIRYDGDVGEQAGLSAWGKDVVKDLSGARRCPSDFMMGDVITIAANNGNSYYFDGSDFVEGDKTIISGINKMKYREFIAELIKLKIIETPTY